MEEKKEEDDKLKVRNSRKLYIIFYIMAVILIIVLIYIKTVGKPLDDLAFQLALAFIVSIIIATEVHRLGNSYEVNVNSVVHKKGYFSIISKTIEFGAISDSDVKQSLWQRMFRFGNIEIHLYSKENKTLIKNINNPYAFVGFLQRQMIKAGGRQR